MLHHQWLSSAISTQFITIFYLFKIDSNFILPLKPKPTARSFFLHTPLVAFRKITLKHPILFDLPYSISITKILVILEGTQEMKFFVRKYTIFVKNKLESIENVSLHLIHDTCTIRIARCGDPDIR